MFSPLFLVPIFFIFAYGAPVEDNLRIVGGQNASEGAFPYMASLRSLSNAHFCGGGILTARTILTAAHCLDSILNDEILVVVGSNHIKQGGTSYRSAVVLMHPGFVSWTTENDIGLVIVESNIMFTPLVQPIGIGYDYVGGNVSVVASGWGRTSYPGIASEWLQLIFLNTITKDDCKERYSDIGWDGMVHDSTICTWTKFGEGTCHGDSGSPLVAEKLVVGIVSWGYPCAFGYPDAYTRVSSLTQWITDNQL